MHVLNVISKKTKPSSRDVIMYESHIKGSMRLYATNSLWTQSLTGKSISVKQLTAIICLTYQGQSSKPHESQGQLACNIGQGNYRWQCRTHFHRIQSIIGLTSTHRST